MFSEDFGSWIKVTAVFSIFGFILSFIVGLFGDVAFGFVLLRALLFGVLFAGISIVVFMLISKFIPELLETSSIDEEQEPESAAEVEEEISSAEEGVPINGTNLDITIEGEDDIEEPEEITREAEADEHQSEHQPEAAAATDSVEEAETVEEIEEVGEAEDVEEAETIEDPAGKESGADEKSSALPDIGKYADGFDQAESDLISDGLSNLDGGDAAMSTDILGSSHDTQELAQAVQTVLKKDQEG